MKAPLSILILLTSISAQAETNWWNTDARHGDRYEHQLDHKQERKHRRHDQVAEHRQDHKKEHRDERRDDRKHHRQEHRRDHQEHRRDHKYDRYANHNHRRHDRHHRDDHYKSHKYSPRKWQTVRGFRGRSGRDVTRYIAVQDRVRALSIQGTKRSMYISEAYALMGNGRWVRVRGLEGYVGRGERIKHRLRNPRYVQKVVLHVEPARHKRGYAELLVRPA